MARIVYLIQTYQNPAQIERLVRTIKRSSPTAFILISHNFVSAESEYLDASVLNNLSDVKVMSGRGGRGGFCLVHGYLNAIDWLLNWGVEFDWLVNLTGQDYPTQPLSHLEHLLDTTEYDGFLDYIDVLANREQISWCNDHAYLRYFYQYWRVVNHLENWQRLALKVPAGLINRVVPGVHINRSYGLMVGTYCPDSPFRQGLTCYAGSYFHVLSRACIEFLSDYSRHHPELIQYYEKTYLPDESYFQTVLLNSKQFQLKRENFRYINWEGSQHGRPNILTLDHYSELLREDIFFARKFDLHRSWEVLERLDQRLFGDLQPAISDPTCMGAIAQSGRDEG